jgi:hypothetical protein
MRQSRSAVHHMGQIHRNDLALQQAQNEKATLIRASVERSPDGNLWVTVRDADTGAILQPPSGPYTDARHFLDVCRLFSITRIGAEELYAVAKRTGHAISGPLKLAAYEY